MDKPFPSAVLFDRERSPSLAPLLEARPVGLLPVASSRLLALSLETLAAAGCRRVDLVLGHLPHLIREWVEGGGRWGLEVRCHSVRLAGPPGRNLRDDLRRFLPEGGLAIASDLLFSAKDLGELCEAGARGDAVLTGGDGQDLPAFFFAAKAAPGNAQAMLRVSAVDTIAVETPAALWRANARRLANLGGTPHLERELMPGLFVGAGCRIHESAEMRPQSLIAAGALLGKRVVVGPEAIVGRAVVLAEASEVANSLVLDGTYVGPHAFISGKIADGSLLVDIASGEATYVDDPAILAGARTRRDKPRPAVRALECALAWLSLAALAAPIGLRLLARRLAGKAALQTHTRFVPAGRDLSGEVRFAPITLHDLAGVAHEHWRRAPWLLAVGLGQLRLVGTCTPLPERRADQASLEDTCAFLALPASGPESANPEQVRRDFLIHQGAMHSMRSWARWIAGLFAKPAAKELHHA